MKILTTTNGYEVLVDDEDYERCRGISWCADIDKTRYEVKRVNGNTGRHNRIGIHQFILGRQPKGLVIDHINGIVTDNRKCNLQVCTQSQNKAKANNYKNMSGYRGVSWNKARKSWKAQIKCRGRTYSLGLFQNKHEAALAYNNAAKGFFGNFARLNCVS